MFQVDNSTAAAALPAPSAAGTQGYFTNGVPGTTPRTVLDADYMNMVMMELINAVKTSGQTPSKTNYNQLTQAIQSMAAGTSSSGGFTNLAMAFPGSAKTGTAAVEEIVVKNPTTGLRVVLNIASLAGLGTLALNAANVGANGIDAGSLAANTLYAIYLIYNPTGSGTAALLVSTSRTAPTLPSGYPYYTRLGYIFTDSSSNFYAMTFRDKSARYVTPRVMASGSAGNISTPTYASVSYTGYAPARTIPGGGAKAIIVGAWNGGSSTVMIAPNSGYGPISAATAPGLGFNDNGGVSQMVMGSLVLEDLNNIWWASAGATLKCFGWDE